MDNGKEDKPVMVYLTEEQYQYVRNKAFKEHVSMSKLFKDSLGVSEKKKREASKSIPLEITKPKIKKETGELSTSFDPQPKGGKK